jgi:hypothetical protein
MENLVSVKPKQVTKNSRKYLKQVRIRFGDAKGETRESSTFDPVDSSSCENVVLGDGWIHHILPISIKNENIKI